MSIQGTSKTVNNVRYTINEVHNIGYFTVSAVVFPNGLKVMFRCLKIEWDDDFVCVRGRLRNIIEGSLLAI